MDFIPILFSSLSRKFNIIQRIHLRQFQDGLILRIFFRGFIEIRHHIIDRELAQGPAYRKSKAHR